MTEHAVRTAGAVRAKSPVTFLDGLFLATVFTVTFAKIQWELAGSLSLSDVLTAVFLVIYMWERLERGESALTRTAVVAGAFFAAFALVYLIGFFNLDTAQAFDQWTKGMIKFVLHFGFLVAGIDLLARKGLRFYWWTLAAFCIGIAVNSLYGITQLTYVELTGANLDASLIQPITGRESNINIYGAVDGEYVFRPNALTGDPNHLGIELAMAILMLAPLYLRLERGNRFRLPLGLFLVFLVVMELATLSRSALLGFGCGLLVLAIPYRRRLGSAVFILPLLGLFFVLATVIAARPDFFETVGRSRLGVERGTQSTHFQVYGFIPDVLATNPLFGLGLNNFSVYYEFVTGRTNFGPHSFYVALLVDSGILGTALFTVFLVWVFRRIGVTRRLGRALDAVRDPLGARVRPLGWGMTAALVGTLASNLFYLTMSFYYFFAFAMLALAAPIVFARRLT
jgi:hypothetical protein